MSSSKEPISASPQRLITVSNRLPVTVVRNEEEGLALIPSSGGLASGLGAYLEKMRGGGDNAPPSQEAASHPDFLWIGWPGLAVEEPEEKEVLRSRLKQEQGAWPVFLHEDLVEGFYEGFSNGTLWPLFHYFYAYTTFEEEHWQAYLEANEAFCEAVCEVAADGDTIWVHDYQLMLLPKMLRQRLPNATIGFFLHIPFPSSEIFRLLPRRWARALLEGVAGADLVGFHTHDYTLHFLSSMLRVLGWEHSLGRVALPDGRTLQADTFPMGIEYSKFRNAALSSRICREKDRLHAILAGKKAVISVDRLDYTKGIIHRLAGWELFLERHPEWHGRVRLILVVVPSREAVEQYDAMRHSIDERVGNINGRWGNIEWTPIAYEYRSLPFDELIAHYAVSDVALVTPLRDGMNLVAKEWIATRTDGTGVLVLSEMAGAAKELGEAVIINPNDASEMADAIAAALEMPGEEQEKRLHMMQERLRRYDVVRWAEDFLGRLSEAATREGNCDTHLLTPATRKMILDAFRSANRRLILSDYDGTLVGFHTDPLAAIPSDALQDALADLASHPDTDVVLISGRLKDTLGGWFPAPRISLIAEHGAYLRSRHLEDEEWHHLRPLNADWKPRLRPILETYVDRLPGSFIEEKEFCLVWHYRKADPQLGAVRARELVDSLTAFTANIPDVQVLQGNKVVELRNPNVNKGAAALYMVARHEIPPDFVLALGDDWTDEDMFRALPPETFTIKIGPPPTAARFSLRNHQEVLAFLQELAASAREDREADSLPQSV